MQYTNTEIIDLLIEGFGAKDTIIFCDMYSALKEAMSTSPLDEKMYDCYWFRDKKEELIKNWNSAPFTKQETEIKIKAVYQAIDKVWATNILNTLCRMYSNDFELGAKIREVYGTK